jgi:hypothetical protein
MTRELLSAEDAGILALESGTVCGHTYSAARSGGGQPAWDEDPGFSLRARQVWPTGDPGSTSPRSVLWGGGAT